MRVLARTITVVAALATNHLIAAKPPEPALPKAPPQPVPLQLSVKRGNPLQIPLRIYGTRNQNLQFLIRKAPAGRLGQPQATGPETAVVQYLPPKDPATKKDQFQYAVKSSEGVSASVEVVITILDPPGVLKVPTVLEFGAIKPGATVTKSLEITNEGEGVATGTISIEAPWKIQGSPEYEVAPGASASFQIAFNPEKAGDYTSQIRFSSQPDLATPVEGSMMAALHLSVAKLELTNSGVGTQRDGAFQISNNTGAPLEVRFHGSSRLALPKPFTLQPDATAPVVIQTAPDDTAPLDEKVLVQANDSVVELPVNAKAAPGVLRITPTTLVFGLANTQGTHDRAEVAIQNVGGSPITATLLAQAPFSVDQTALTVEAGKSVQVTVSTKAAAATTGELLVQTPQDTLRVALEARPATPSTARTPAIRPPSSSKHSASQPDNQSAAPGSGEPATGLSRGYAPKLLSLTPTSATLTWSIPGGDERSFEAESRTLAIENGELVQKWSPIAVTASHGEGDVVMATLDGLKPGTAYMVRIAPLAKAAEPSNIRMQVAFETPGLESGASGASNRNKILLGLLGVGIVLWLRKKRQKAGR